MTRRDPELSIVVLAYDEEENIGPVLEELFEWLDAREVHAEVLVVDDGSRDATADRAREALSGRAGKVLRHVRNRGMGAGLKTGTRAAAGRFVTFLPADGQIPPSAVGTLLAAREGADVVLSVYAGRDDGLHRKVLSAGVRALIATLHGVRLRSEGPYLFRRTLFVEDQLPPDTFFLNFEFPLRVLGAGLRVQTVTVRCRPRRAGASKTANTRRAWGVARDLVELRVRRARVLLRLF